MKRQSEIVNYLYFKSTFTKTNELASIFKTSERTIRNDLNEISHFLSKNNFDLQKTKNEGILLIKKENANIKNLLADLEKSKEFYQQNERIAIILLEFFLLKKDSFLTYSHLVEKTISSKTTIINDFMLCEKWLNDRNISVNKIPSKGICFEYEETNLRKVILEYVQTRMASFDIQKIDLNDLENEYSNLDAAILKRVREFLPKIDVLEINKFINKCEKKWQIKYAEDSISRIFIYIIISLLRISLGYSLKENTKPFFNGSENEWINENRQLITKITNTEFNAVECQNIYYFMISQNRISLLKENNKLNETELVDKFLTDIQDKTCVTLSDDKVLYESISIHMSSLFNRLLFDVDVINPLKDEIKNNYKSLYVICCSSCGIIEQQFNKKLSDDEICYLVLHIAAAIEKKKNNKKLRNVCNAVVVCTSGLAVSNMIRTRIASEFPEIVVEKVMSIKDFYSAKNLDVDLVISNTHLDINNKQKQVVVTPLLNKSDVENIRRQLNSLNSNFSYDNEDFINELLNVVSENTEIENYQKLKCDIKKLINNKQNKRGKRLSDYVKDNLVLLNAEFNNSEDIINKCGQLFYLNGSTDDNYQKALLEAYKSNPQNIIIDNKLLLPHVTYENTYKTSMVFITLKKPIKFAKDNSIKFVVALAADKSNEHLDAMSDLLQIISDDEKLKQIIKIKTFKEFKKCIKKFENK